MRAERDRDGERSTEQRDRLCQLAIIADDLTGACDAAIAFTTVAHPVTVHLTPEVPANQGVCAITTNSRDIAPAECKRRIAALQIDLPAGLNVFKKIDSVFRGNTFAEIAMAAQCFPADLVLIAPAYPALGRRVRAGELHVQAALGSDVIPLANTLAEHGCPVHVLRAAGQSALQESLRHVLSSGERVVLCDAWTEDDLNAIVAAVRSLQLRTLWVGSGGLAHALAATYPPHHPAKQPEHRPGRPVFLIGSDHPVTEAQVRHLQSLSGLKPNECGTPNSSLPETGSLLTVARGQTNQDDVRAALSELRPDSIGCLFMTGGDTALLVCLALGIHSLLLDREFAPGVPLAFAQGGRFHGVPVIVKSGGFGEHDLLCRIHDLFCRKEEALA